MISLIQRHLLLKQKTIIYETDKQIHYQLDMSQSVRDFKMRTNVDTSRDTSLFAAQDRLSLLDELKEEADFLHI